MSVLGYYYYVEVRKLFGATIASESSNLEQHYVEKAAHKDVVYEIVLHENGNLTSSWVDNEEILSDVSCLPPSVSEKSMPGRYFEPFVGGGSMAAEMGHKFDEAHYSDMHPDLMLLWSSLLSDGCEFSALDCSAPYNNHIILNRCISNTTQLI